MGSRRQFLKSSATSAAFLIFSTHLVSARSLAKSSSKTKGQQFQPNIFLKIYADSQIEFIVKKSEMGQHIHTALAQIAMDELCANMNNVKIIQAKTDEVFKNIQTGGSYSVPGSWLPLRTIMAKARMLLQQSACQLWKTKNENCLAENGYIVNTKTSEKIRFGDLIDIAKTLEEPADVEFKNAKNYNYIGHDIARLDTDELLQGKSKFGIDIVIPHMLYATMIHAPLATCEVGSIDKTSVKLMDSIVRVIDLKDRVAIVATDQWSTFKASQLIQVKWRYLAGEKLSTKKLNKRLDKSLILEGVTCRKNGNISKFNSHTDFVAEYYTPFAAHMSIEPPNATVKIENNKIEVWAPTQQASAAQKEVASYMGVELDSVTINTTLIGGSFGRKLERDFILEAVKICKKIKQPVKLIWSRESDMQSGFFRPCSKHLAKVSMDNKGMPIELELKAASPSVFERDNPSQIKNGHDWSAVLGLSSFPYTVKNLRMSHQITSMPEIPITWWRGTYSNHNCFAIESLIDELAIINNQDPLEYRLMLLQDDTKVPDFPGSSIHINNQKLKRVLTKSAEMIGWKKNLSKNIGFGIACHCYESNSYAAHAVQVERVSDKIKINKVVCAFDVGIAINPDSIKAQLEGSIIFGITSVYYNEILIDKGKVKQSNFHDQPMLRLSETPVIEIHLYGDGESPGGVGECGLPSVAPAITNALSDITNRRFRSLPIKL